DLHGLALRHPAQYDARHLLTGIAAFSHAASLPPAGRPAGRRFRAENTPDPEAASLSLGARRRGFPEPGGPGGRRLAPVFRPIGGPSSSQFRASSLRFHSSTREMVRTPRTVSWIR